MGRKKTNVPAKKGQLLVLVASVLALAGIVVWQSSSTRTSPTPPAAVQLQPVTVPAPSNDVVVAAPSKLDAAPAPVTDTASAVTSNKKAPARVQRHEPAATVAVERRANTVPPSAPNATKAPARATNYEQRVNAATAVAAEDSDRAVVELKRLATDEPNRPEAYEAMAGISLTKKDYAQARERIESALAKGGKATFTAIHDHSRGNFDSDDPKSTCVGELTILADEVRFEPREGTDRFSASWANVRDAGSNKFFGSGRGGFHVTVNDGGKYKNFNLAPGSKDKDEGKLILDLLKSYAKRSDRTK